MIGKWRTDRWIKRWEMDKCQVMDNAFITFIGILYHTVRGGFFPLVFHGLSCCGHFFIFLDFKTRFLTVAWYFIMLQNCWNLSSNFPIIRYHFSDYHKHISNEHAPNEIHFEHHRLLLWAKLLDVKWLSQSWTCYMLLRARGLFLERSGKWQSQECEPFSIALFTYRL